MDTRTRTGERRLAEWGLKLRRRFLGTDDLREGAVLLRMLLVVIAILGGFTWVVAQAAVYQVGEQPVLTARGNSRLNDDWTLDGRRGDILDRTGRRLLAVSVPVPSVAFYGAKYFVDRTELAYTLAEALSLDPDEVIRKILGEDRFAMLKRHVSPEEAATITRLSLPGVRVLQEDRRYYPMGPMFGAGIGYVGKSGQGLAGVELKYDPMLKGLSRTVTVLRDASRHGFYNDATGETWDLDGANLVLAIDAQVQLALDAELMDRVQNERALGAMAVVLDAKTFEVLAMSSAPAPDPNEFEQACGKTDTIDDGSSPCRNKVISYVYEPGSIGKMLTIAAAYDSGKVKPGDTFDGHLGTCKVGTFTVTDVHKVGRVTALEAIKYSSNCATKEIALRLGTDVMRDALERFGLGRGTGIDLPGEAAGVLRPAKQWGSTVLQTASYGYGYNLTLMEIAASMATLTNGGVRLRPRVARELRGPQGEVLKRFDGGEGIRVVSPEAARMALDTLTTVVMDKDGTGTKARPTGYTAGGKTGTARANIANQGYTTDRYLTSFVGFAPAEDPRIVVAVTVIDPKENRYGGTVAAPVFRNVVERVLPILGVMPNVELPGAGSRLGAR